MKKIILLLFLLLIISCNKKQDKLYKTEGAEIEKNILIGKNKELSKKERIEALDNCLKHVSSSSNNIKNRIYLSDISNEYYNLYETEKLGRSCYKLLKLSTESKDSTFIGVSYNFIAKYKFDLNQNDSSYYYFLKAEKTFLQKKDSLNLSKNYIDFSNFLITVNNYIESEKAAFSALKYSKKSNLKLNYLANNLIGISSTENQDYRNAIRYLKNALEIATEMTEEKNNFFISTSNNNIGYVYQKLEEQETAINYFKKGLKENKLFEYKPTLYADLTDNYAYSKFKSNDFNELPGLFYVSLKIREKNNLNQGIIINKIHLSEYYNYIKDTIQSRKFANEALQLAKKTKISGDILASLKQLSTVDEKNAVKYSKEYIRLSDSVQNEERKAKDRFARIAYETDEVIQKNTELEVKNRNLVIFLFGTIVIFFLLYAVRTQKMRNRELAFKQEQQESNRQIYNLMITQQEKVDATSAYEKNRIAQELHDGILSKMFGTRMNLDSLNESTDNDSISMRYTYIQALKSIEQEIREISHDLSSEKGKLINNFVNIVMDLLTSQNGSFETNLVHSIDKTIHWERLDNTAKINLYRILQESLQNINKYAMAKTISVSFTQNNDHVVLRIEDDGVGFDLAKKKKGIGLKNMISRTEESNGNYEIISELGKGTVTTVKIPLNTLTPNQIE